MSKTRTEVKARYNNKVYDQLSVRIPKLLNKEFSEMCEAKEVSKRQAIIMLIEEWIGKK